MLHPRLSSGGVTAWLASIGPTGSWGDLSFSTRWGENASGMFEATWTMPLPADFSHPLLRRGTIVEIMDGPWRVGSPLILAQPGRGSGYDQPWNLVATGVGREVEGDDSFYALDGVGAATTIPSAAVDRAITTTNGWPIAGRDASVPTTQTGGSATTDGLQSLGALLTTTAAGLNQRWFVDRANVLRFKADPTAPTYQTAPGVASLGVADDDYSSVVIAAYLDSGSGTYQRVFAENAGATDFYRRREFGVDLSPLGAISAATAQGYADGILATTKGRLNWTNGLSLTSNDLLTMGGVPADLTKVLEDVSEGCMVRVHGMYDELLELTGKTYIDIVIGEAKLTDGAEVIDLSPLGLAPRDLAAVVESITGMASAA